MAWLGLALAIALIVGVFVDAFEVVVLPRRVRHSYRLARLFYRTAWVGWRGVARLLPAGPWRQGYLSTFGPLSLFALVSVWAAGLVLGFALLHYSLRLPVAHADDRFSTYLYFSGTTFFTLGYGDMVPTSVGGRMLSVMEAGIGFVFLAVIVSYLPVIYQAFSKREITISLLDARAGSPPTACEMLKRLGDARSHNGVGPYLIEWERWSAELLESTLSYPLLSYYRSQHGNQSWVAALMAMLDTSALLITTVESSESYQARLTFAMARHAAVDLALVFLARPRPPRYDRLSDEALSRLRGTLSQAGWSLRDEAEGAKALTELRGLYEPFVVALAKHFEFELPPFQAEKPPVDNWQTSPWMARSPSLEQLPAPVEDEDHF